jgi:hypothetical protein
MRHALYRWTGQTWAKVVAAAPVQTLPTSRAGTVSAEYSDWYTIGASAHRPPQFPSWNITLPGYYAIGESIRWLDRRGAVVARHTGWLSDSAGDTSCRF